MTATAEAASAQLATPETYLNTQRAMGFLTALRPGVRTYPGGSPGLDQFALKGPWDVTSQSATAAGPGASIAAGVQAAKVYLVLTSSGNVPRRARVLLDGHPIPAREAGADVHSGTVTVRGQRLYALVSLPRADRHTGTIEVPAGVSAYDFTFG